MKERMIFGNIKQGEYTLEYMEDIHEHFYYNYYEARRGIIEGSALVPQGFRLSTAAEELAIQLELVKRGEDPAKADAFAGLFGSQKSNCGWRANVWTDTGLRIPKNLRRDYETDAQGRKFWPRIVLIGDQEVGEILVPEGNDRVVVEWNEAFGIPQITEQIDWPHKPYTTHFVFADSPGKDTVSGHCDVAVICMGYLHEEHDDAKCLRLWARWLRNFLNPATGLRLVKALAKGQKEEK